MAKFNNNILIKNLSGKIAGQVVAKTRGDKTFLASMPRTNPGRRPNAGEMRVRMMFNRAVHYAKKAMADPELKKAYTAARRGNQTAYNVAFKDAYVGPRLTNLRTHEYHGGPGQTLKVEAMDNFRVTRVTFTLLSADRTLIETGDALQAMNGFDWVYTSRVENPSVSGTILRVTAEDFPKNQALLESVL